MSMLVIAFAVALIATCLIVAAKVTPRPQRIPEGRLRFLRAPAKPYAKRDFIDWRTPDFC